LGDTGAHRPSPRLITLESMTATGNTLDDFPAGAFTILVFCDACEHRSPLDRSKVPDGMSVQNLVQVLRCSACGARKASIRIVYTGAGGFEYGEKRTPG